MKLVIDIPDDFYDRVNKDGCMSYTDAEVVVNAFFTGTLLPKGHGRLVDEDDILNNPDGIYYDLYDVPSYMEHHISTVVEADKECRQMKRFTIDEIIEAVEAQIMGDPVDFETEKIEAAVELLKKERKTGKQTRKGVSN